MFKNFFFDMPPELMTALATVIGFAFLGNMTGDQQNSFGNFLMLIGQALETNSAQKQLLEDIEQNHQINAMRCTIEKLEKQVNLLISLQQPPLQ